jgi:hypothetical protein
VCVLAGILTGIPNVGTDEFSFQPNPPQHVPRSYQLLNCGGWWKPFAIEAAVVVRCLIDALDSRHAQHRQAPSELFELLSGQDWLGIRAACHG